MCSCPFRGKSPQHQRHSKLPAILFKTMRLTLTILGLIFFKYLYGTTQFDK